MLIEHLQPAPHFIQDFIVNILQRLNSEISVIWGDWGIVTSSGAIRPKCFIWHNSATTYQIFTNKPLFCLKECKNYFEIQ